MSTPYYPKQKSNPRIDAPIVPKKKPTIKVEHKDGYFECSITTYPDEITPYNYGCIRYTKEEIREYVLWQTKVLLYRGIILPQIYA